jgi:hypothetical protein
MVTISRKSIPFIFILFFIALTSVFFSQPLFIRRITRLGIGKVSIGPSLSVIPEKIENFDLKEGDNFTVDLIVNDVSDVYAWQVEMHFDPYILECSKVDGGDFPLDSCYGPYIENEEGSFSYTCMLMGDKNGVGINGKLATVTFYVKGKGMSNLGITDSYLLNINIDEIDVSKNNGYFLNSQETTSTTVPVETSSTSTSTTTSSTSTSTTIQGEISTSSTTSTTTTPGETSTTTPMVTTNPSGSGGGTVTTTTSTTTTTTITTTSTTAITTSSTTTPSVLTTLPKTKEMVGAKTAWYLFILPIFVLISLIVWFVFLRKPKVDEFDKLKEKWSG